MTERSRSFHHLCFEVADLEKAAGEFAQIHNSGPFFGLEHAGFDEILDGQGRPCTWHHSLAFGLLGGQLVELNQTHALAPAEMVSLMASGVISHVAFLADDLDAECARLESLGAVRVMSARTGPVRFAYHHSPVAGRIETFQSSPFFEAQLASITAATRQWDGTRPLRPMSDLH